MADSNQFHATCLDTLPPIFYLNDTSRQIIRLVHAFNNFHGKVKGICYYKMWRVNVVGVLGGCCLHF